MILLITWRSQAIISNERMCVCLRLRKVDQIGSNISQNSLSSFFLSVSLFSSRVWTDFLDTSLAFRDFSVWSLSKGKNVHLISFLFQISLNCSVACWSEIGITHHSFDRSFVRFFPLCVQRDEMKIVRCVDSDDLFALKVQGSSCLLGWLSSSSTQTKSRESESLFVHDILTSWNVWTVRLFISLILLIAATFDIRLCSSLIYSSRRIAHQEKLRHVILHWHWFSPLAVAVQQRNQKQKKKKKPNRCFVVVSLRCDVFACSRLSQRQWMSERLRRKC